MGSAASGFWNGVGVGQAQDARKDVKERDEREAKLQTLVSSGLPPAQVQQGIRDIYGQDAPALQRHVENLFRRVAGKQPQQAQAPKRASDLASLEAQGTTPEQRASSAAQSREDAAMRLQQLKNEGAEARVSAPKPVYKEYSGPDGQRQWFKVEDAPEGWNATQGAVPAPKPGTPRVGTSGGRNVYGLLTPNGWVDAGTQQPLKDFRPLPTYAQVAPSLRPIEVVDPSNPGNTKIESAPQAIKEGAQGTKSVDFKMQMPTAQERGRADLATSAREQLGTMESILQNRSDLFGPESGRYTNFTEWVGSQDPDAQRFQSAARIAADHLAGVFGGRSQAALQGIYDVIGKNSTNPQAAIAGLEQMNIAAARIQSKGQGPAPRTGSGGGQTKGTKSLKAAMALPQNKGKTADQVKQDLQAHGYGVAP